MKSLQSYDICKIQASKTCPCTVVIAIATSDSKFIKLLITLLWGQLVFGSICLAKTETDENTEKEPIILNHLKDDVKSLIKPIISGEEANEGLFSGKWGKPISNYP